MSICRRTICTERRLFAFAESTPALVQRAIGVIALVTLLLCTPRESARGQTPDSHHQWREQFLSLAQTSGKRVIAPVPAKPPDGAPLPEASAADVLKGICRQLRATVVRVEDLLVLAPHTPSWVKGDTNTLVHRVLADGRPLAKLIASMDDAQLRQAATDDGLAVLQVGHSQQGSLWSTLARSTLLTPEEAAKQVARIRLGAAAVLLAYWEGTPVLPPLTVLSEDELGDPSAWLVQTVLMWLPPPAMPRPPDGRRTPSPRGMKLRIARDGSITTVQDWVRSLQGDRWEAFVDAGLPPLPVYMSPGYYDTMDLLRAVCLAHRLELRAVGSVWFITRARASSSNTVTDDDLSAVASNRALMFTKLNGAWGKADDRLRRLGLDPGDLRRAALLSYGSLPSPVQAMVNASLSPLHPLLRKRDAAAVQAIPVLWMRAVGVHERPLGPSSAFLWGAPVLGHRFQYAN